MIYILFAVVVYIVVYFDLKNLASKGVGVRPVPWAGLFAFLWGFLAFPAAFGFLPIYFLLALVLVYILLRQFYFTKHFSVVGGSNEKTKTINDHPWLTLLSILFILYTIVASVFGGHGFIVAGVISVLIYNILYRKISSMVFRAIVLPIGMLIFFILMYQYLIHASPFFQGLP